MFGADPHPVCDGNGVRESFGVVHARDMEGGGEREWVRKEGVQRQWGRQ